MPLLLQVYGNLDPIPFKITKNGAAVPGLTFSANDIQLSVDGAAGTDISSECTETTLGLGWYQWQPTSAAQTQANYYIIINVKEVVGTNFDENGISLATGGHGSARHSG